MAPPPPPSRALIPELKRLVKRPRLPDYDEPASQNFNRAMDAWSKRFAPLVRARAVAAGTDAQRQYAVVDQFLKGYSDQNVIWGVLVKRPHLVPPLEQAARALRLPALAKEARTLSTLLPPPEHAGSAAKRITWYNSPPGDRPARRANAMLMRLLSREESVWKSLLKWALAHPDDFFAASAKAPRTKTTRPAQPPARRKSSATIAPGTVQEILDVVRRRAFKSEQARRLTADLLRSAADGPPGSAAWRTLATVAECDGAVQGDGFFHFVVNDPALARRGATALRRIGMTRCAAAVAAVRRDDDPDSARVAKLASRYQAGRDALDFERAVLTWAARRCVRG